MKSSFGVEGFSFQRQSAQVPCLILDSSGTVTQAILHYKQELRLKFPRTTSTRVLPRLKLAPSLQLDRMREVFPFEPRLRPRTYIEPVLTSPVLQHETGLDSAKINSRQNRLPVKSPAFQLKSSPKEICPAS